jgi:hypothetical protein
VDRKIANSSSGIISFIQTEIQNSIAALEKKIPAASQNPIVYYSVPVPSPNRNEPPQIVSGVTSPSGDFSQGISTGGNLSAAGNVTLGGSGKTVTINSTLSVNGVSGLTDADIPDSITASNYLPLSGGTISGALTGTNLTLSGNLTVSGAQTLSGAITVPYLVATSTTTSSFVGNVGIGTTSPYAQLSIVGNSTNPYIALATSTNGAPFF